jgi:hypothetical protein
VLRSAAVPRPVTAPSRTAVPVRVSCCHRVPREQAPQQQEQEQEPAQARAPQEPQQVA